ncbi:hypothetical protein [Streptomyces sp. CBMA123]|uniref:hypothetical protein n=1 Tax=Streptomyces sp. CBMA123 TaxID=1896313 RepID=UPI001661E027|nr:hypothetical protein [Streptomyces sp. CBMA123]
MAQDRPMVEDLHGVWWRTLVREADGSTDRATAVSWIQGPSLFGDLRQPPGLVELVGRAALSTLDRPQLLALCEQKGFAGTFAQQGDAFGWVRRIDLHPPAPLADAGTLRWEGEVLVEEGLHENYLEHWVAVERPSEAPAAALFEDPAQGCAGVLVRAGSWFAYARDRSVLLPAQSLSLPLSPLLPPLLPLSLAEQVSGCGTRAEAAALLDCEVSIGRVRAGRWEIVRSTLPNRVGGQLAPELNGDGDGLRIQDADPQGRARPRSWRLARVEGPARLLAAR